MKRIYMVKDELAGEFSGPMLVLPSDAVAIRTFGDIASAQGNQVNAHPEDFAIYELGMLGEDGIASLKPRVVIDGKTWKAAQAS